MIVIADTSPINYLVLISRVDLLEKVFQRVMVPTAVVAELCDPRAPTATRAFIQQPPCWLDVRAPDQNVVQRVATSVKGQIGAGEVDAIALAKQLGADLLLADDLDARHLAQERYGLRVMGTLGILLLAARHGLVDLTVAVAELRATGTFRASDALIREVLGDRPSL